MSSEYMFGARVPRLAQAIDFFDLGPVPKMSFNDAITMLNWAIRGWRGFRRPFAQNRGVRVPFENREIC